MEDIVKSMKAHLYDRVSSPLLFSFVCSWVLWNYRLIIIVISGDSAAKKFTNIDALPKTHTIFSSFGYELWSQTYWLYVGVLGPLLTTLFYLVILPHFETWAYRRSAQKTVDLKKAKIDSENATLVTEEEGRRLKEALRAIEKESSDEIEGIRTKFKDTIADLRDQLDKSQADSIARVKELNTKLDALRAETAESENIKADFKQHMSTVERNIKSVYLLDAGARDLLDRLPKDGTVSSTAITREDPRHEKWLSQLIEAELIEVRNNGEIEVTAQGSILAMYRSLRLASNERQPTNNSAGR